MRSADYKNDDRPYKDKQNLREVVERLSPSATGQLLSSTAANEASWTDSPTLTKLTVTTIELGHASDTTLSRKSAGVMNVEGNAVPAVASVVAGDILYASGTQVWARLAKGSNDDVLTLASGVPSWAAPTASGWTTLLARTDISGAATYAVTGLSAYNTIQIILDHFQPATGGAELELQVGISGPTYRTSGYDTRTMSVQETPTWSNTNHTNVIWSLDDVISLASGGADYASGIITLHNFGSSGQETQCQADCIAQDGGVRYNIVGSGEYSTAEAHDAIQFTMTTGNIGGGFITILGLA